MRRSETLFDKEVLDRAETVYSLQKLILDSTEENLEETQSKIKEIGISAEQILLNIMILSEYRPRNCELYAKIASVLPESTIKEFCQADVAKSFSPEHLYFLSLCIKDDHIEKLFSEKIGDIDLQIAEYEQAILDDDVEQLEKFFSSEDFAVDARVRPSILYGCHFIRSQPTLIQFAAFWGSVRCFKALLGKGANLFINDLNGRTITQFAVAGGNTEIIQMCRDAHCDFTGTMKIAVRFHRNDIFTSERFTDDDHLPLLHQSVVSNNVKMMLYCIDYGSNVNKPDASGFSPIHIAAKFNSINAMELLINCKGINVNIANANDGKTALHITAEKGFRYCLDLLLNHELVNQRVCDKKGRMAFHVAAENGFTGIMKSLLDKGVVTINSRTDYGATVLHLAVTGHYIDTIKFILSQDGVDTNAKTLAEETALHCASMKGSAESVALLLEHGVEDINAHDRDGCTALHNSLQSMEVMNLLLKQPGIDVNSKSKLGCTTLQKAASENLVDFVAVLIDVEGILVNERDNNGWTALHSAAKAGAIETIKVLLTAREINVNIGDNVGWTPLHSATKYQHHDVMNTLLEVCDLDINKQANDGWTALHLACLNHDEKAKSILLNRSDINRDLKDSQGRTAEDLENMPVFGGEEGEIRMPAVGSMGGWNLLRCRSYFDD